MHVFHSAWTPPEPEWVTLAPGVRWRLQRPDGEMKIRVTSEVAQAMAKVYAGRAGLESMMMDPEGDPDGALTLERISGYSAIFTACLYAQRCLLEWNLEDPDSGDLLDTKDPEAIKSALLLGAPPHGEPLLSPFLAWVDGPRYPMAAEKRRLQALARDHFNGGLERCRACQDESDPCALGASTAGELCPRLEFAPQTPAGIVAWEIASTTHGLWRRCGMSAALEGLDYRAALMMFEAHGAIPAEGGDLGSAFSAFTAIERGRMEAEVLKAEAKAGGDHG